MLDLVPPLYLILLGSLAGSGLALGLGACYSAARHIRRIEDRVLRGLDAIEADMRILALSGADTERRIQRLERSTATLRYGQQQLESRGGTVNYRQAISLVERGWRTEDLVRTCGLTRGEAELVYLLHGPGGGLKGRKSELNLDS